MPNSLSGDHLSTIVRARLLELRNAHRLTDAAWARASGQRQQDVSRFTNGKTAFPPLDFLDALAQVFDLRVCDVIADELPQVTTGMTLSKAELEHIINLRGMEPSDRAAFFRLARPRKARGAR